MTVEETLTRAESDLREIWHAFHGQVTSLGDKTVLLLSYTSVALEHYEAITVLARKDLFGSALALARSVYEIMWHSGWANAYATPEQLRKILNGKFDFPNAGDVVKDLDKAYGTGAFFQETHKASWKHLNSYTHTGKNQLLARMTGTDLEPSYSDYEKIFVLDATRICAAMTAVLALKAHGRVEDAAKIEQILLAGQSAPQGVSPDKRIPPDREIVNRFVEHMRTKGLPDLKVDSWQEDEHPGQSVVEAIADPLAIEHTSVDTLPDQRRIGEQFMEALADLEPLSVQARLTIAVPYELVTVGSDWGAYRAAIEHWIVNVCPTLDDGEHTVDMPNSDLECEARKESDRPHGVFLRRPAPDDDTLVQRVQKQVERKMKKLRRYKADGHTTVLILETRDIALMNQHKMLEAVREAVRGKMPAGLDQIWYAEADGHVFFDFTAAITTGSDVLG
jgi:hypothetical protein